MTPILRENFDHAIPNFQHPTGRIRGLSVVWATADGPRLPLVSRQNTELRALQGTSRGRGRVGRFRTNSQAQLSQRVWLGIQEKHPKMSIFVWFVLFVVHFFAADRPSAADPQPKCAPRPPRLRVSQRIWASRGGAEIAES